ncbi:MAG: VOC family protein [Ilumatobacteraceae bacterium]|nr:VOC family protein [Acidimicrobiaceae bacterium]MBP7889439.1 VOC family protein [Ilumatobacteraceae bacterium]MBP8208888.1 VOC family protein [Ilumatobacteraceae bacterium]MBP9051284.1 VOC family protein [Ilumatobacteraceae bacterium]HQY16185.1 VOC family protein [Ilumatobacteraceae bacterium]
MPIMRLDHFFVRANDLEVTRAFYCEVLGFEVMPRPDFPFPGYWLGVDGSIQVHMAAHGIPHAELFYLGTTPESATDNSGVVDHIAFLATDPEAFHHRFGRLGLACRKRYFGEFGLCQMFIADPNGVTIELNFHGLTAEPAWGDAEDYASMPRAVT